MKSIVLILTATSSLLFSGCVYDRDDRGHGDDHHDSSHHDDSSHGDNSSQQDHNDSDNHR